MCRLTCYLLTIRMEVVGLRLDSDVSVSTVTSSRMIVQITMTCFMAASASLLCAKWEDLADLEDDLVGAPVVGRPEMLPMPLLQFLWRIVLVFYALWPYCIWTTCCYFTPLMALFYRPRSPLTTASQSNIDYPPLSNSC